MAASSAIPPARKAFGHRHAPSWRSARSARSGPVVPWLGLKERDSFSAGAVSFRRRLGRWRRPTRRLPGGEAERHVTRAPPDEARDDERNGDDPQHDGECAADGVGEVQPCDHQRDHDANRAIRTAHVLGHRNSSGRRERDTSGFAKVYHEKTESGEHGQAQQARQDELGHGEPGGRHGFSHLPVSISGRPLPAVVGPLIPASAPVEGSAAARLTLVSTFPSMAR